MTTRRADGDDKEDEDVTMSPFISVRMWRKKKTTVVWALLESSSLCRYVCIFLRLCLHPVLDHCSHP